MFEEFLIAIIFKIAEICSKLPFSKIYLATPDFWMLIVFYIAVAGIVYLFNKKKIKVLKFLLGDGVKRFCSRYCKKIITFSMVILVLFNLDCLVPRDLKIYFVDVAQRRLHSYKKSQRKKCNN